MWRLSITFVLPLSLALASALAADIVYVTDLTIFTSLAPCAAYAISKNIQYQTYNKCPEAVTDLQACVCTKNNNFASISADISSDVSSSCGSTASEDQASAQTVLTAYCNQDKIPSFPTPATPVSAYITDIPEFSYLAPCAASAVSYAINSMSYDNCPSDAPLLATCVCNKNQNSLVVSQIINTSAKYSCSGHTADISSAQAMFRAYCNLNNGTSSFPPPALPPGDMTYYITDLPKYSSLAPCAYNALSYAVQYQSYSMCPEGPMALASCACLKEGVASDILSSLTSSVKYNCGTPGTDDISSAVAVFDFYCSAAKAEVTAAGVTNSVSQTYKTPTGGTGGVFGGPQATSGSGDSSNGGTSNGGTSNSNGSPNGGTTTGTSKGANVGLIAGVIAGVVAILGLLAGLIVYLVKKKKSQAAAVQPAAQDPPAPTIQDFYNGKQELGGTAIVTPMPPPSPSTSTLKAGVPGRTDNVSPVSAHAGAYTPPPNKAELHGQTAPYPPMPNSAELQGQGASYPPMPNSAELYAQGAQYPPPNRPELQGQGAMYPPPNRSELQGQGSPHFPPPNRPELAGYYAPQMQPPQMQMQQPQMQQQQMSGYYNGYGGPQQVNAQMPQGGFQGQQQPQRPAELAPVSWQSGPVPGFHVHEMDGNQAGQAR
ncbi:hypothetical protein B0H66DRAFT_290483 [Apodospora peruviana]|uniref:Uncharacterized protein n=1 Tax=Apodospora peruviana TaxID=516989 RepID=A0AAE0I0G9_9PEZI|nr:hypothetical protein B0H66DRAFT_290483 [Apodospora peruviana]